MKESHITVNAYKSSGLRPVFLAILASILDQSRPCHEMQKRRRANPAEKEPCENQILFYLPANAPKRGENALRSG